VGVLLVLGVTLGAVVVFTQVLGFQAGVLTSLQALDVRRLGESLVPVEGIRLAGDIIVYNNGLIPTCFLEVRVVGTTYGYSVTNCNPVTMDVVPPRQYGVVNLYDEVGPPIPAWRIRRHSPHTPQQDRDLQGGFQMTESGRIGVKAVSTVIAAVIVLTVFLALASAIYTGLLQLGNESSNLVKREAERAMESFFQIYWLNNTHVVLFNNHSSVPVTLLYWVSINPASGAYTVTPLNPATYTVPPGTRYIIQNPPALYRSSLNPVNRVVSERGTSFEVGDAPSQPFQHFTLVNSRKLVRPGFTSTLHGPLSQIILSTGPGFLGGACHINMCGCIPCPSILRRMVRHLQPRQPRQRSIKRIRGCKHTGKHSSINPYRNLFHPCQGRHRRCDKRPCTGGGCG
jgi:hypothetical protein